MNDLTISPTDQPLVQFLTPSELLGMFTSFLSQQEANRQVIFLKGIYLKNPKHNPQTGLARVELLQDGHRCAKIDVKSDNGVMTSAYMHDL